MNPNIRCVLSEHVFDEPNILPWRTEDYTFPQARHEIKDRIPRADFCIDLPLIREMKCNALFQLLQILHSRVATIRLIRSQNSPCMFIVRSDLEVNALTLSNIMQSLPTKPISIHPETMSRTDTFSNVDRLL